MRQSRLEAETVKACAVAHGVSPQAVNSWRRADDQRWANFKVSKKAPVPPLAVSVEQAEPILGEGLAAELRRLKRECLELSQRLQQAVDAGLLAEEALLHRILDAKRETLRKLAKDEPDVAKAAGDVVPVTVFITYAAQTRSVIETLATRIASLMPAELTAETRQRVRGEVDNVLEICAQLTEP